MSHGFVTGVVVLRFGKSLYAAATIVVACSLTVVGLAWWQSTGSGDGTDAVNGVRGLGSIVAVLCAFGAAGVLWLGWYWLGLAGGITSMAERMKNGRLECLCEDARAIGIGNNVVAILSKAVAECFEDCRCRITRLDEDAKDLQLQLQLSRRREKNSEAIIQSIRDAVIVIDGFDKLLMANEAAGRLFGFDFKSSQYKPIRELIGAKHSAFLEFVSDSKKGKGHATRRELDFPADEKPRTFDCVISCVHDEKEDACGAVAVLHDITREKEVSQMKNDFVSHVSHELKTPLASITAYSEMLADGEADNEEMRTEFYSVIQGQAKRLNRLIEDILNISRIESGLIKVSKETASLTMLIEEQMQMIRSYAEEKQIDVIWKKPIVFDQVYVDRDMLSQVIINLLSNAIKYTPANGSVRIETAVDEAGSVARVSIRDTGVGIPADEVEHVFEKFYRVGANKKQAKGTGLGLNLVKQIVETVHNGQVFVSSEVGVGSTFGFELPLAKGDMVEAVR